MACSVDDIKKAHGKRTEGRLKIQMIKLQGGVLAPLDELESEELKSSVHAIPLSIVRCSPFLNSVLTIGLQIKQNGNTLMSASNLTPFVNI